MRTWVHLPKIHIKKSGDVALAFNSSAKATEPSGSLGFTSQPQLMRTCIKKPKWIVGTPYLDSACTVCSSLTLSSVSRMDSLEGAVPKWKPAGREVTSLHSTCCEFLFAHQGTYKHLNKAPCSFPWASDRTCCLVRIPSTLSKMDL